MKQLLLAACTAYMLVGCNNATTSTTEADTTAKATETKTNENVTYAYPVAYASDFEIGDSKYAQTILEIWKDFDNNTLDNHASFFLDSMAVDLPNGSTIYGKDSVLAGIKAYRGSMKSAVSSIEVVTSLKPKGKDETWVCVWGKEVDTYNNGKTDSTNLHEVWMFDKNGKIAYMGQYQAKPPKMMK